MTRPARRRDTLRNTNATGGWYGVRMVFDLGRRRMKHGRRCFEDRVVVVQAKDHERALDVASRLAAEYARVHKIRFCAHLDAFAISSAELASGTEVFSTIQATRMAASAFLRLCFGRLAPHADVLGKRNVPARPKRTSKPRS